MSRKKTNKTGIPDFVLDSLARALLPAIQKYFETEEGKKAFENWKQEQLNKNPPKRECCANRVNRIIF